tara:strand:+ start:2097 stop:2300 length:204 start_codon:yes stop_codon:yes gene_type:complete
MKNARKKISAFVMVVMLLTMTFMVGRFIIAMFGDVSGVASFIAAVIVTGFVSFLLYAACYLIFNSNK